MEMYFGQRILNSTAVQAVACLIPKTPLIMCQPKIFQSFQHILSD